MTITLRLSLKVMVTKHRNGFVDVCLLELRGADYVPTTSTKVDARKLKRFCCGIRPPVPVAPPGVTAV